MHAVRHAVRLAVWIARIPARSLVVRLAVWIACIPARSLVVRLAVWIACIPARLLVVWLAVWIACIPARLLVVHLAVWIACIPARSLTSIQDVEGLNQGGVQVAAGRIVFIQVIGNAQGNAGQRNKVARGLMNLHQSTRAHQ